MISLANLHEALIESQQNYIHAKHWPVYDRFIGWLYHFGLVQKGSDYSQNKRWRGLWVDIELKDTWLERLNNIPCVEIVMTCAGHGRDTAMLRFIPFCDPRADSFATPLEKISLEREIKARFGGLADVGAGFGPDGSSPFGHRTGDLLMEFFTLTSPKPRNAMSKTELNNWWEATIARLEEYAEEEVQHWGPEAKGGVMPKDLQPPFFGHWYKLRPGDNFVLDQEYVGPFDTIEEAYVATEEAARNAGVRRTSRNSEEQRASTMEARSGDLTNYIDGTVYVEDVHNRRYYGPLSR